MGTVPTSFVNVTKVDKEVEAGVRKVRRLSRVGETIPPPLPPRIILVEERQRPAFDAAGAACEPSKKLGK